MKNSTLTLRGEPIPRILDDLPSSFVFNTHPILFAIDHHFFKWALLREAVGVAEWTYEVVQFPDGRHAACRVSWVHDVFPTPGWRESVARDWVRLNALDAEAFVEADTAHLAWV